MLTNAPRQDINEELIRVGLEEEIVISKFVFHDQIPKYLSLGDFAINPVKPVPTKRFCTSIKDGEYWAMGLPVVISPNISDDSGIIERENTGVVVDLSDKNSLPASIGKLEALLKDKIALKDKIRQIAIQYRSFNIAEQIYKEIYK